MADKYPSYDVFAIFSNEIRRDILNCLKRTKTATFVELVSACDLDMLWDCGTLGYHLDKLVDEAVIVKTDDGYELTDFGKSLASLLQTIQIEISKIMREKGGKPDLGVEESSLGISMRRGKESDAKALADFIVSLSSEGKEWDWGKGIKGREEDWIHKIIRHDRVHEREYPYTFLYFAFDGLKMIGQVNGIVADLSKAPPNAKQHVKDYHKKILLEEETVGGIGISVRKDYRRKGIGKMLMHEAISESKKLGATVLTVNTTPENSAAISFFSHLGFKEHVKVMKGEKLGMHTLAVDHLFMKIDVQQDKKAC